MEEGKREEAAELGQTLKHAKEACTPGGQAPPCRALQGESYAATRAEPARAQHGAAGRDGVDAGCVLVHPGQEASMEPGTQGVLRKEPHSGTGPGTCNTKSSGCLKGMIFKRGPKKSC